jgi:FMN-dependent NADH-azoreductase
MRLLHVNSSARGSSVSWQLTSGFVNDWKEQNPTGEVMERDLAKTLFPPPVTDEWVQAVNADPTNRTGVQRWAISPSDIFIGELAAADTIVIGAPMHNFTISWPLRAWFDHIVRLGRTVVYGAKGPNGLLQGKTVAIITSRGGSYGPGAPGSEFNLEPYLRRLLGFIGLTDPIFIYLENRGNEGAMK